MAGHIEANTTDEPIKTLLQHRLADGLPPIAEMIQNAAMLFERAAFLQAAPCDRAEVRNGHANGFTSRMHSTAQGKIDLRMPLPRLRRAPPHLAPVERFPP